MRKVVLLLTITLTAALIVHANAAAPAVADSGDLGLTHEQMEAKYGHNWPYIGPHYCYVVTDKKGIKHELPASFWDTVYSDGDINVIAHYSHRYGRVDTVTAIEYVARGSHFDDEYIEMLLRIHNLPISTELHNWLLMQKVWPPFWIDKTHYIKCDYATEKEIASGFTLYESFADEQKKPKLCHEVELGTFEARADMDVMDHRENEYYAAQKEGGKEEALPPAELVKAETDMKEAWKQLPVVVQNKLHDDQLKWAKRRDSYKNVSIEIDMAKERTTFLKEALEDYNQNGESAVWGTEPD